MRTKGKAMSPSSSGNVTSINSTYLKSLVSNFLQPLLDEVDTLLQNGQVETVQGQTLEVPQLDGTLSVPAGSNAFPPATQLINALGKVGSSVNADLNWFQTALSDTIDEINTTIATIGTADDLNAEQAQTLAQDFAGAISAVSQSPTGGSGGSGPSGSSTTGSGPAGHG
jgi:hypothetical protein